MQEIKLNTNAPVSPVQQTNLESVLNTLEAQAPLAPLLSASSLQVTSAPVDLEALLAQLNVETSDTKEAIAKSTLSSAFTNVIARAEESGKVSAQNMQVLNDAKNYSVQLDQVTQQIKTLNQEIQQLEMNISRMESGVDQMQKKVDGLKKQLTQLQTAEQQQMQKVESLQADVDSLNSKIESETDPVKKAQLEKQLTDAESKLAYAQNDLTKIQQQVSTTQTNLNTANTALTNAKTELASKKAELADKKATLETAKATKTDLEGKIKNKMNELTDVNVIRDLADALKLDVSDVMKLTEDNKAERSEEQEKYLDKHSPLRIMQDAVANHDQEMLDTIASKREEKI